jgi:hypothetical protein
VSWRDTKSIEREFGSVASGGEGGTNTTALLNFGPSDIGCGRVETGKEVEEGRERPMEEEGSSDDDVEMGRVIRLDVEEGRDARLDDEEGREAF